MTNETQLIQVLQNTVDTVVRDIARAQELTCDFVVSVSPFLEADYAIKAGYPPTLVVKSQYVMEFILSASDPQKMQKLKKSFRRDMSNALAKVSLMEHTLAHNPPARMIAILPGSKKWVKTNHPDKLTFDIPDEFLSVTEQYTVTMTEINSGITVTLTGDNPSKLRAQCKERLNILVATNQALLQKMEEEKIITPPISSIEVKINKNTGDEQVSYNFESPTENKE